MIAPIRHAVAIRAAVLSAIAREVVLLAAVEVVGGAHLGDLALAEPGERRREEAGDLGAERRGDLGGAGEEEVAGDDGEQVAPAGVDARDVAPARRLVHHVVVVERGEVHELDRDAAEQRVLAGVATRQGRGSERQRGAQPLAAGLDEVRGDLVEEGVAPRRRRCAGGASSRARSASGTGSAKRSGAFTR